MKQALQEHTFFGTGKGTDKVIDHEILDRPEFGETELLRQLQKKAQFQIGTSGSGNHFVEFGEVELLAENNLGLPAGYYLGLLSHSGSRGLGATIANYFTKVAMDKCRLPRQAQHLAWLDLDSAEGQEYWLAMNLAGDYAKACHDVIHQRLTKALGLSTLAKVENHHNFAWREEVNNEDFIVHRKGATPAKAGEFGIIPGSMTAPGFIVSGKGESSALNSASHGAGRKLSRKAAKESTTGSAMKKHLKEHGVELIGGGLDEAPLAYKNIQSVMEKQKELVQIEGTFTPKVVRMNKD
jgi:tRNA-splicing ligase RtcB